MRCDLYVCSSCCWTSVVLTTLLTRTVPSCVVGEVSLIITITFPVQMEQELLKLCV